MQSRLRQLRKARHLNQEELAARAHTTQQQVSKHEKGLLRLNWEWAERYGRALDVKPATLLEGDPPSVPIIGYVGAGATVSPFDSHEPGQGIYRIVCPDGLDPDRTEGLQVKGDSMSPIDDGWLIFYTKGRVPVPADIVNKLCVVQLADGTRLIKQVRRGYSWGRFNLHSTKFDPIEDVELATAAPMIAFLHPDATERIDTEIEQHGPEYAEEDTSQDPPQHQAGRGRG